MLSSSRDAFLKLFKTTSPQNLFPSDCITLYLAKNTVTFKIALSVKENKKTLQSLTQIKPIVLEIDFVIFSYNFFSPKHRKAIQFIYISCRKYVSSNSKKISEKKTKKGRK